VFFNELIEKKINNYVIFIKIKKREEVPLSFISVPNKNLIF